MECGYKLRPRGKVADWEAEAAKRYWAALSAVFPAVM